MTQTHRLAQGGRIDRGKPLSFTFNGKTYRGHAGDTVASALLANGVHLVGRSWKYHRPRGIVGAGVEEPNALLQLGTGAHTVPNPRATEVELHDGLTATSVNCWPGPETDVRSASQFVSRFLPAGFYYKTFMWPASFWMRYEHLIRKASGLGEAPREPDPDVYDKSNAHCDVLVVGTGPAGLAAAVYGASEGLTTIAVDDVAIGGQAGTSSRIENYLGFPTGISGGELAFRAEVQALKFGARVTVPRRATALSRENGHYVVRLDDKTDLRGRSVVVATGARYRRLALQGQEAYEGAGIYYAATELEARMCRNAEVVVVGGGNASGQAAMFLAGTAKCVHLVYRGADLDHSMSRYLISRLEHAPNVRFHAMSEVNALHGETRLEAVTITSNNEEPETVPARALFVMIGSDPCTDWLQGTLALDNHGFVVTGVAANGGAGRAVAPYETSMPGVFAVGDVRSGSVKRVASAVGEGSVVVQAVHQYLADD
jgi:thioredoxin reductase